MFKHTLNNIIDEIKGSQETQSLLVLSIICCKLLNGVLLHFQKQALNSF